MSVSSVKSISEMNDQELEEHLRGLEAQKKNLQREVNAERARRLRAENATLSLQQQHPSSSSATMTLDSGLGTATNNAMVVPSKISQPPSINEANSYDGWLKRFSLWEKNCGLPDEKKAGLLIESIGNNSKLKRGLQDKFFDKFTVEQMTGPTALTRVKDFLKKELAGNDIDKALNKWDEFEECIKADTETVETFIDRFDAAFTTMAAANPGLVMPSEVKAFMLVKRSKVCGLEKKMVQSKLDFTKKDTLYEQTETALREVLGAGPGESTKPAAAAYVAVPEEDGVFLIGGKKYKLATKPKKRKKTDVKDVKKKKNKIGPDGKPMRCFNCKSEYHFAGSEECSTKKSSSSSDEVLLAEAAEVDSILAAGQIKGFTWEARGAAALDTCCTSSVAGQSWLDMYLEELDDVDLAKVEGPMESSRTFGFGNNGTLTASKCYKIPVNIAGKVTKVKLDIISSDIPLLLSISAMEKANTKMDLEKKTVTMFGNTVPLLRTSSGHPIIRIQPASKAVTDNVFLADSNNIQSHDDQMKILRRLHAQFGHMTKKKFLEFLKISSVQWLDSLSKDVQKIIDKCEGCIQRKRNPDRPAVALPMASKFNEKVAMDLKHWDTKYICYFIDLWSGFTQGIFIEDKKPSSIINAFCLKWVGQFGSPAAVLHDCGGEFTAEEYKEMTDVLNIEDLSTAGYSPWQNGYCEKHHAVTDAVLKSLVRDHPNTPLDVLLAWACMVKNTAYLNNGFSAHQLVYGTAPNLPNILDDTPSSLREEISSETLASHLNSLNAARISFNKSIADKKIKVALKKKIRCNNTVFYPNDMIYWKKTHNAEWRKGKVLGVDGKILFVRNSNSLTRVSVNRAIKAPYFSPDNVPTPSERDEGIQHGVEEEEAADEEEEEVVLEWRQDEPNPFELAVEPVFNEEVILEDDTVVDDLEVAATAGEDQEEAPGVPVPCPLRPRQCLSALPAAPAAPGHRTLPERGPVPGNHTTLRSDDAADRFPIPSESLGSALGGIDATAEEPTESRKRVNSGTEGNPKEPKVRRLPNQQEKINLKMKDKIVVNIEGDNVQAEVLSRGKIKGKFYNHFNVRDFRGLEWNLDLERNDWRKMDIDEEVMMATIPMHLQGTDDCRKAKKDEIEKLRKFNAISEVKDEGQFRISCRWVLWNKKHSNNETEVRARLVARGYEEEDEVPSDSPTVDQMNLRLLLGVAASNKWRVTSCDVKSAFLQGKRLQREVVMKPPPDAKVPDGILWKLNVALYGLDDASLQFHFKCKEVFTEMGLKQSRSDPAMFYQHDKDGKLSLLLVTHVDDFLVTAKEDHLVNFVSKLSKKFEMGREESWNFKYCGFRIFQSKENFEVKISQDEFANEVEIPKLSPSRAKEPESELSKPEQSTLRGIAGKIGWLARGTRPDLLFPQLETSTKFGKPVIKDLKQGIKSLKKIQTHENFVLVNSLGNDISKWRVEVASDASWRNLSGGTGSTQAGIVLLTNGDVKYPVLWWANKIKRTCNSAMEAELLSMNCAIDQAVYLRETLEEISGIRDKLPVTVQLDNNDCYQAVHANVAARERRLRGEIARVRDNLILGDISNIVLVSGKEQLANGLTKATASNYEVLEIFQTGRSNSK